MDRTALLVMDVQRGIVERFAKGSDELLANLQRAIGAARSAGIPVIYVRVGFRSGAPEVSHRNKSFAANLASGGAGRGESDPETQVHPAVAPQREDVTVIKRRVSAFAGSDLDVVLRSLQTESLILTGIATSGVVLSTLRQAADLDFRLTVLRDCCLDTDEEVNAVLLNKVFPRQAEVLDTDEWLRLLPTISAT